MPHILLHLSGELSLKGRKSRKTLLDRLVRNLRHALDSHGYAYRLDRRWSRIIIESEDPGVARVAARVFGVKALAVAERREWTDLDDLVHQGTEIFAPQVSGRTFAVRVKRGELANQIPFRSPELERLLGARLVGGSAGVKLRDPEIEARIELQGQEAYFYGERLAADGGLPVGTSGRALVLFSGGFDSPVAAWQMLRRGIRVDYCFFDLGGREHQLQALRSLDVLVKGWSHGYQPRLHLVDFKPIADEIRKRTDSRLWQVILKRQMLRAAGSLCRHSKAQALVTGECLSQVSSQTLANLRVLDQTVDRLVLRPLVTWNKEDIIALARHIGTHDASAETAEFCALDGKGPETHASLEKVLAEEEALDPGLLDEVIAGRLILDTGNRDLLLDSSPSGSGPVASPMDADRISPEMVLLDLRSKRAFDAWHPPNAVHAEYPSVLEDFRRLDRSRTYVAYCEVSLKSAHLAEAMAAGGYRAHWVDGGTRSLIRESLEKDPMLLAALSPASILDPPELGDREDRDFD